MINKLLISMVLAFVLQIYAGNAVGAEAEKTVNSADVSGVKIAIADAGVSGVRKIASVNKNPCNSRNNGKKYKANSKKLNVAKLMRSINRGKRLNYCPIVL